MVISIITWNVTVFDHIPTNHAGNIREQAHCSNQNSIKVLLNV